ncbi:MAG TPA: radical SAM protein [Terriglobales bacterium]|nr:radical SAM protein [Terriglobales bacterium]
MLERYFDVLKGKEKPHFQKARRQNTEISHADLESAELTQLWRAHDAAVASLKEEAPGKTGKDVANLLELKSEIARRLLSSCCFCQRRCGADRAAGEKGVCGVPALSNLASEFFHHGEENELVPSHTIFFAGCNFKCVYCQNFDIATRPEAGMPVNALRLAAVIDEGRRRGSRNVNFVGGNPDPHLHTCMKIISLLESEVPVVWNSNAFASVEAMKLLDGVVDVFLSDFRYGNDGCAKKYSLVKDYWPVATRNFLLADEQAEVMLRHLVLPGHLECCTAPIMEWASENIPRVYFNLMFQYHPEHRAYLYPEMDRRLTHKEIARARELANQYGIEPA